MKKILTLMLAILCLISLFTACNKDTSSSLATSLPVSTSPSSSAPASTSFDGTYKDVEITGRWYSFNSWVYMELYFSDDGYMEDTVCGTEEYYYSDSDFYTTEHGTYELKILGENNAIKASLFSEKWLFWEVYQDENGEERLLIWGDITTRELPYARYQRTKPAEPIL